METDKKKKSGPSPPKRRAHVSKLSCKSLDHSARPKQRAAADDSSALDRIQLKRAPSMKSAKNNRPRRKLNISSGENGRPKGEPEGFSDYSLIYEIVNAKSAKNEPKAKPKLPPAEKSQVIQQSEKNMIKGLMQLQGQDAAAAAGQQPGQMNKIVLENPASCEVDSSGFFDKSLSDNSFQSVSGTVHSSQDESNSSFVRALSLNSNKREAADHKYRQSLNSSSPLNAKSEPVTTPSDRVNHNKITKRQQQVLESGQLSMRKFRSQTVHRSLSVDSSSSKNSAPVSKYNMERRLEGAIQEQPGEESLDSIEPQGEIFLNSALNDDKNMKEFAKRRAARLGHTKKKFSSDNFIYSPKKADLAKIKDNKQLLKDFLQEQSNAISKHLDYSLADSLSSSVSGSSSSDDSDSAKEDDNPVILCQGEPIEICYSDRMGSIHRRNAACLAQFSKL